MGWQLVLKVLYNVFSEFFRPLGCTAPAMLLKQARGTYRKHITKPLEQAAAPDCIFNVACNKPMRHPRPVNEQRTRGTLARPRRVSRFEFGNCAAARKDGPLHSEMLSAKEEENRCRGTYPAKSHFDFRSMYVSFPLTFLPPMRLLLTALL